MPLELLKRGDLVEVRSPAEILSTLDGSGALESLPFMPEMVPLCGRRFTVDSRTEKICDTVHWSGSRRLRNAVFLAGDPRCSGSGHDGCQAQCRVVWKEAWLRKVEPGSAAATPADDAGGAAATLAHDAGGAAATLADDAERESLLRLVSRNTQRAIPGERGPETRWRCQATDLPLAAGESVPNLDPRTYLREYTCGNVGLPRWIAVTARAAIEEPLHRLGMARAMYVSGPAERAPDIPPLNLQPGELVRVKSRQEIEATLSPKGKNRGLWFDREMLRYCGGTFRVKQRLNHFIDDQSARMVDLTSDAVMLEGVVCTGDRSPQRWFCARQIYPWWRECWLERAT